MMIKMMMMMIKMMIKMEKNLKHSKVKMHLNEF